MSDYKELLERTARYSVLSDEASRDTYMLHSALHAVLAKLDATESERKAWENTAGCLRTDLEYMTRRAEQAEARLAEYERFYSCLLYTSPSPRDGLLSRMPSSA